MAIGDRFDEEKHPRGGDPANRGRFSPGGPSDPQDGGLDPDHEVHLDPYGRPDHCRWNEWYWTVRPRAETYRDSLSDEDYNYAADVGNPPDPRNPEQIAGFWLVYDNVPDNADEVLRIRDRLARREKSLAPDFYMWESGFGAEDLSTGLFRSTDRQYRKFEKECEDYARGIPNPLHQETGADLYVALQMYTDARCLDARNGKNADDPDSATNQIGEYWQTESGRRPKEVIETCRLVHVMDLACRPFPGEPGHWQWKREDHEMWTGGRTYVKPFNPWKGITVEELFDGAASGRDTVR